MKEPSFPPNVSDKIIELAKQEGLDVHEKSDLVAILERLSGGSGLSPLLVLTLGEILSPLFRLEKRLASTVANDIIDVTPSERS